MPGITLVLSSLVRRETRYCYARGGYKSFWKSQSKNDKCIGERGHHFSTSLQPFLFCEQANGYAVAFYRWMTKTNNEQLRIENYHTTYIPSQLKVEPNICNPNYDGLILVSGTPPGTDEPEPFKSILYCSSQLDAGLFEHLTVLPINLPSKRLIYSPTGPIDADYDDVRVYNVAAVNGIKRALQAGVRYPLLILLPDSRFENVELVTLLGALEALYVPLEVREIGPDRLYKAATLGVWSPISSKKLQGVVKLASVLESGRYVARDIGGSDPERMTPTRIEEYIHDLFSNTCINVQVISDPKILQNEYPLFSAVNRAAADIPRYAGRIIFLTYEPKDPTCVQETVMLVGKGVTYDTGGADIKINHAMVGMSRDKCGAAASIGFMQTVNLLQPSTVKVVAAIGVVRNNCGEKAYVADEVITARSGARVRVNNTDAEGRMVMADILYHIKEMALCSVNPHIFTIATLTGHAQMTAGKGYSIAIDNSVARIESNAYKLQACGEVMGDMFEVSILRREDFALHKGQNEGDDVIQSGKKSSASTERGHQGPVAFLMLTSGLNKHGKETEKSLKFCHLDIAASAGDLPDPATGVPILALSKRFLAKEFENSLAENQS